MFKAAEIGHSVGKADFDEEVAELRVELLRLQDAVADASFPVVIIIDGDDRVGCNAVLNRLHEWMDARFIHATAFEHPPNIQRVRPPFWQYWNALPQRGRVGVMLGAWTQSVLARVVDGDLDPVHIDRESIHIRNFERALSEDGALVIKLWIHLPKKELRKRVKKAKALEPTETFVRKWDRRLSKNHDEAMRHAARILRLTGAGHALWNVIESTCRRHRDLSAARVVQKALQRRLDLEAANAASPREPAPPDRIDHDPLTILDRVDLTLSLDRDAYREQLANLQLRLARASKMASAARISTVAVFEGADAAGKGGAIRRLTAAMDAAHYRVIPIGAPTEIERKYHYLWRFWRHIPRDGYATIFDRSWYGRVLVERVEGFARREEWKRAYAEINDFEEQLVEHGAIVLKFWLHIDQDEQLSRFQEREKIPFKLFKITDEDYRNRERAHDYELAANDMFERTSTDIATWNIIPANSKWYARIKVLETYVHALEERLGINGAT